jgi:hypothetical protein
MRNGAAFILLALLLSGCGGGSMFGSSSPGASSGGASAPGWTDRIARFFDSGGSSRSQPIEGEAPPPEEIDCPPVVVRQGASTYRISAKPNDQSAMAVRYQGTIARTARDCHVVGQSVVMKVGVEGRMILGPAGQPGKVEVPLRFAVVHEGPTPTTIVTKTYRVAVELPPGSGNVPFFQIDDSLSFPLASSDQLALYVVYVGFDPDALKPQRPTRRPVRKRR